MSKVLVAPTGALITGTEERLSGVALIQSAKEGVGDGGRFELEYVGDTEIWWDETKTEHDDKGERLFLDEQGNEWPESQLELVDEEALGGAAGLLL